MIRNEENNLLAINICKKKIYIYIYIPFIMYICICVRKFFFEGREGSKASIEKFRLKKYNLIYNE